MKVLVFAEVWGKGGIETFISNEIEALQKEGVQFTVLTAWCRPGFANYATEKYGVPQHVIYDGFRPGAFWRTTRGLSKFGQLLKDEHYDAVHINTMNGTGFIYSWVAKRNGVPVRLVHSHNTDVGKRFRALKRFIGKTSRALFGHTATARLACSSDAGCYLFGDEPFTVVPNGIDIERFRYNGESRAAIREELNIGEDTTLIGNIGHIGPAKNPLFQIEVFAEYLKLDSSARYLMLGGDELLPEVLEKASELGVSDRLIVRAPVDDPAPWYCALDAFLMPSLFEGLAYVRIEAQCAGVPMLISDVQTPEADLTELSEHMSLECGAAEWAQRLYGLLESCWAPRETYADLIHGAGYGRENAVEIMKTLLVGSPLQ